MTNLKLKTQIIKQFWSVPFVLYSTLLLVGICFIVAGGCNNNDNTSSGSSSSLIPSAPSGLIATAISLTAISISWTDTTNTETGFYVESRTPPTITYTVVATLTANTTVYTDTGLTPTTTVYYRVKAFNFVGESAYSNEASTVTSWDTTDTTTAVPSKRKEHKAVWADNIGMVVWGGWNDTNGYITSGGVYSPTAAVSWTATAAAPGSMHGRIDHTAIWTGSEVIIWGGHWYNAVSNTNIYLYDGGIYDPALNSWTPITPTLSPVSRSGHAALWTDEWMVVCGGYDGTYLKSMAGFNPAVSAWVYYFPDMDTGRREHTAIWTGSGTEAWRHQIIIWGGYNGSYLNTGQSYHMETNQYQTIPITNAPSARCNHTVVWTGSKMIIWGGFNGMEYLNTGGIYDPTTNSWKQISTINAPIARMDHTAIWTGSKMIVWGGGGAPGFNSGGMYDPQTDTWTPLSTINGPVARGQHTAVWTGTEMIVWGGWDGKNIFNTGGLYKVE
jgi:hypothetical protein